MVLLPCSYSCPPTLVPLFGDDGEGCGGWRTALSSQGTSSPRTWYSSAISPSSFGPSLIILGHFPPQLSLWAYYSKWARVPRSFGPTHAISFFKLRLVKCKKETKKGGQSHIHAQEKRKEKKKLLISQHIKWGEEDNLVIDCNYSSSFYFLPKLKW